jgi:hypothetical protein
MTGAGATAQLQLPDGSTIAVLENSLIQATRIETKPKGVFYNNVFYLDQGRIDAVKVKYADGQAPLSVQGKHATLSIRGTHFRITQAQESTLAEIEQGRVSFAEAKIKPLVKTPPALALGAGQGAVADGVHDSTVINLLTRPDFSQLPAEFLPTQVRFTVPTLTGAIGFRGELALDDKFAKILTFIQSDSHDIVLTGLKEGRYHLRLRALDQYGLQGQENHTMLIVKTPPYVPPPVFIPLIDNGKVKAHWNGGVRLP